MTLRQAFELIAEILTTMKTGEIRLFIKNGEIRHVNKTEEIFPSRENVQKS